MTKRKRILFPLLLLVPALFVAGTCWYLLERRETAPSLEERSLAPAGAAAAGGGAGEAGTSGATAASGEESLLDEGNGKRVPLPPPGAGTFGISGRAVMKGGGPPPRPVTLSAAAKRPPFSFLALKELNRAKELCITTEKEFDEAAAGARTTTGPAGRFAIKGLAAGRYHLVPFDPLLHVERVRPVILGHGAGGPAGDKDAPAAGRPGPAGDGSTGLRPGADGTGSIVETVLVLEEGGALKGTVRDSRGRPLAGVAVTLRERFNPLFALSGRKGMLSPFTTATGREGSFRFRSVPCGVPFVLDAFKEGYGRTTGLAVPLRKGAATPLDVVLADEASISGIVRDTGGSPAAGKKVRLARTDDILNSMTGVDGEKDTKTESAPDGTFRFGGLAAGTYRVFLDEKGMMRSGVKGIALEAGQARKDVVLVLDKGLAIAGRIVDSTGKPVRGVRVKALPAFSLSKILEFIDDSRFAKAVATDEEGRFRCSGLAPGSYDLEISREGITDTSHKGIEAGKEDLVLTLKSGGIAGIVVSTVDAEPVKDYRLFLEPEERGDLLDPFGFKSKITRSVHDEKGRFEILGLKPASYTLTVKAEGFGTRKIEHIAVADGETAKGKVIMLAAEASVSGTVFDKETGAPVEGARISLKSGIEGMIEGFQGRDTALTDEAGRYTFGGLSAGPVRLFVSHTSYESLALDEIVLDEGERIEKCDIALSRGAVVRGHVYAPGGRAVPGAVIMASSPTGSDLKSTRTDEEGAYELAGFSPGTYTVMHMPMKFNMDDNFIKSITSDFDIRTVTLKKDQVATVNFVLGEGEEGGGVHGRVTEAGRPVPGALISLVALGGEAKTGATRTATTDKDGRYAFEGIAAGDYTFRVVRTESLAFGGGTEVVFRVKIPGNESFEYDMELPGGSIEGRVMDAGTLKDLAGIRILVRRSADMLSNDPVSKAMAGRVGEIYSGGDGRFRIGNLRKGKYDLFAGGMNMLGVNAGGYAREAVRGIEVLKGQAVRGIRIRLEKGGTIEGFLKDRGGNPVAGASVFFQPAREGLFDTFSECYSDASGKFRYTGLAAGRYTLAVKHPNQALTLVYDVPVAKEKTRTVKLRLGRGTELKVRVTDKATGETLTDARVDLVDRAGNVLSDLIGLGDVMKMFYASGGVEDGVFSLGRYAPGTYYLRVSHGGYAVKEVTVEIPEGEETAFIAVPL